MTPTTGAAGAALDGATTAHAVADAYLTALAGLDPQAAEALGHADVVLVPDLSPEAFAARADLARAALTALDQVDAPGPGGGHRPGPRADEPGGTADDARLGVALRERLASDVALDEAGFTQRLLAPLATPVHAVREVFDALPRRTQAEWERVAEHLALVPRALRQYRATLERAADSGHVVAARQVRVVAEQCERWVADRFYPGLVEDYRGDAALAARLEVLADEAATATAGFAAALRGRLLARAGEDDAVGRAMYEVTARAFLGARVDLDELYAWGWEELRRLRGRAVELAREIVGKPDVAAAAAALDADPARRVEVGDPLQDWLQQRIDTAMDAVDGVHFDVPTRTRAVEARMTTAASGIMYYSPPDAGLTRPGRVWWTVPAGTTHVSTWQQASTLHHEGVPGHHLQHAITLGLARLHPWQRALCHVHGYAEGWAHYAEQLAEDLGLVRDTGERLGLVLAQTWRACRIVIDIGLHLDLPVPAGNGVLDARQWSPELGVKMLRELALVDPTTATFEVDRYLGWPGQALAFKVGARLWERMRADAQHRAGPAFDAKEFHMAALALGPMGLDPLADVLNDALTNDPVPKEGPR